MGLIVGRLPQDNDELWHYIKNVWGMEIPRENVCPEHSAPFDALADAYFARYPITMWKASRGFGGKSTLMGCLCTIEAATLGAQITVLGGSASQSQRVHEVTHERWAHGLAPSGLIAKDPTKFQTKLSNGGWITALMASQKSVRGPHPQRMRLDEVDEMEIDLFEAAQGQPMDGRGLKAQTVISSTHQYPNGTMTELLRRAAEKGWKVYEWCWRESVGTAENPGWLTQDMVERKKHEVSTNMWNVEYDLQEPSFAGRAIDTEYVDVAYDPKLGVYDGELDELCVIQQPLAEADYITGVDWAKEKDFTVIRTFRTDVNPWQEVVFLRTGRKPWGEMIRSVDDIMARYEGLLVHDATGIGNVIDDIIEYDRKKIKPIVLRGRDRESIFTEYIAGIEQAGMVSPRIKFAHNEHKYVTQKDLFGSGHPPDSFIAGAMAWSQRRVGHRYQVRPANIVGSRKASPWKLGDEGVPFSTRTG